MLRHLKKSIIIFIVLIFFLLSIRALITPFYAYAEDCLFTNVEGEIQWNRGAYLKKESALFKYNMDSKKVPTKMRWNWQGTGEIWMYVKFSDGNIFYYIMEESKVPHIESLSYIDNSGIPRIIVPHTLELPKGNVSLDILEDYHRFCGDNRVSIKEISFNIDTTKKAEIRDFEAADFINIEDSIDEAFIPHNKKIYVNMQIPQGNEGKYYVVENKIMPMEIKLRAMQKKSQTGYFRLSIPQGLEIISYDEKKLKIEDNIINWAVNTKAGYYEESTIILVKGEKQGALKGEFHLGTEKEELFGTINCLSEEIIKNSIDIMDEGIYPIQYSTHKTTVKKDLKNFIRIKENVWDTIHKILGNHENEEEPAGVAAGVLKNHSGYDIPLRIKFSVVDDYGMEIKEFRGEHLQQEAESHQLPELITSILSKNIEEFKLPVYADSLSVKPGIYKGRLQVFLFGTNIEILCRDFQLHVEKEKEIQSIVGINAIILSIISFLMIIFKHKKWLGSVKTSEIILISLFTAVKFSIVDIPYFVLGDLIRALLAPLGPFVQIFTGVFWDIVNPMLLVTLVILVRRPGVVIISTLVRLVLKGIAFGSFNPITILLMLAYAAIADFLFYTIGFTKGKREIESNIKTFIILALIFAVKHIYSTYTFYYIWSYLYRLYYPDWYININAIISVGYAIIGCICGVYLGKKLERVID
jgi:hypothetical protein